VCFETGSDHIVQAGLELLSFKSDRITGVPCHIWQDMNIQFKKEITMVSEHLQKYSTLIVENEMKINAIKRSLYPTQSSEI
jgi:hypothetical protein